MEEKVNKIVELLKCGYKDAKTELEFEGNYQLLVAVMLSAQCTDMRVNIITKELFKKYGTPQAMLTLSVGELSEKIKSCGLFRNKANNILAATAEIVERYNGEVPSTVEELETLPGVGRKTALVTYAVGFGGNAFAVDTHVFRVSRRIGLAKGENPLEVERELCAAIDEELWTSCHHYLLFHGRQVCKAINPDCQSCELYDYCEKNGVKYKKRVNKI